MTIVIKAENISKKYIINHQKQDPYRTFADSLTRTCRQLGNRILHPFSENSEIIEQEEFWALKEINFEIKQGDRIGIIGRNGAGKSTLLKILSRITEPTTGKIGIKGRVASLLEVGTGFHPELTGRENIFLNGAILGMTKRDIQARFDEIVAFAEIEKFLDTPVKRYSSGMYVRLAFAVAAHLDPEIFIVDEVLAVGDAQFQKKCLGKMKDVSDEGRTILFVSHSADYLTAFCSKAMLLSQGELIEFRDVQYVTEKYLTNGTRHWEYKLRNIDTFSGVSAYVWHAFFEQSGIFVETDDIKILFKIRLNNHGLKDIRVAVGIKTISASPIGTTFHRIPLHCGQGNSSILEVTICLNAPFLVPGKYLVDFSIGDAAIDYQAISDELCFEIINNKGSIYNNWNPKWGSLDFSSIASLSIKDEMS